MWGWGLPQPGWAHGDGWELCLGWTVTCMGPGLPWGGIAWDAWDLIVILGSRLPLGKGSARGAVGRCCVGGERGNPVGQGWRGSRWGTVLWGPEGRRSPACDGN